MYRKLKEGDKIEIVYPGSKGKATEREKLTVVKQYRNFTLCENEAGFKKGVATGTLIASGILRQDDEKESLRNEAEKSYGAWHKKG